LSHTSKKRKSLLPKGKDECNQLRAIEDNDKGKGEVHLNVLSASQRMRNPKGRGRERRHAPRKLLSLSGFFTARKKRSIIITLPTGRGLNRESEGGVTGKARSVRRSPSSSPVFEMVERARGRRGGRKQEEIQSQAKPIPQGREGGGQLQPQSEREESTMKIREGLNGKGPRVLGQWEGRRNSIDLNNTWRGKKGRRGGSLQKGESTQTVV